MELLWYVLGLLIYLALGVLVFVVLVRLNPEDFRKTARGSFGFICFICIVWPVSVSLAIGFTLCKKFEGFDLAKTIVDKLTPKEDMKNE